MSFKLNDPPYKDDKIKVYKVPMEEGVLGKANNAVSSNSGFTIHINQNINDTPTFNKVVDHEKEHTDQMARGDLAYNDDVVIWKGKEYPRDEMEEGNHDLAWEKEIYDEQGNTSPMAFKLRKGSGNMPQFQNLSGRGLIKPAPTNRIDYNHDGTTEHKEETEEEKKARLKKEAEEKAKQNMKVVNTTTEVLDDGSIKTIEDLEGEGESTAFSEDPDEKAKQLQWIKDNPEKYKELLEKKKIKDQRITITPPETKDVPKDPEPLQPENLATYLDLYRIKNNIDMTYYDPEKPGGRQTHTPESYYEAHGHFRDFVEAQKREAINAGQERLDGAIYDDVDEGTNYTKTPLDMKGRKPVKGYVYLRKTNR